MLSMIRVLICTMRYLKGIDMKKVHVIQHTHWDFEWYFTRNEAIVQFVYHMDEVFAALEKQQVDYYLLDGQMSILDDYLDAYPEKRAELRKWIKAGRLFIGPWYTQTDELIITGESIIRNLSLGMQMAQDLGGGQKIGYLPDSFGQGADMPKIYNGMDIHDAVFWRGLSADKTKAREFNWKSEDDSDVSVVNIKDGYFVGVGLIYDDNVKEVMKTIVDGTTLDDIAFPVGGDQRYVDYNLKDRINFYNQQLIDQDTQLVESNYPQLFTEIHKSKQQLDDVSGEFISSSVSKIHRSIYSSRYDQKYLNDKLERRMIYQLEPLMAMADRVGIPYKKSLLDKIWKLIVRNQAHDSAGGCNSDKTNQIILERLREADQLSYSTVDYLIRKIAESEVHKQANQLTFFNTLPFAVQKNVKFQISLKSKNFEIFNGDEKLSFDVWKTTKKYHGQIKRDESQYAEEDYYYVYDCSAKVTIPALQWINLQVKPLSASEIAVVKADDSKLIKNHHYQVSYHDGQLDLLNLQTSEKIADFIKFIDDGDEGDTYDYSPAYQDRIIDLDFSNAEIMCKSGQNQQNMVIQGDWLLPQNLKSRAEDGQDKVIKYELNISLDDSNLINVHLLIDNQVEDHRMRAIIQTNTSTNKYSYADTGFGYIAHPTTDPHLHDWKKIGWHEEPTSIYPMLHYVNLHDNHRNVTVYAKGIKEYQIVGNDFNQIALTLFRSVGFLGRPDLQRRPGVASGNQFTYIPTPDSQLKEQLHFKFAIELNQEFDPAQIMKQFQKYAISNPYYQIQDLNQFTNTLKYFVMHDLDKKVQSVPFLEINSDNLVFSSLTESKDESGWLLRIYNPNKFIFDGDNDLVLKEARVMSFTDFTGKIVKCLGKKQTVSLGLFKPGEIKTIKVNK